MMFKQNIGKLSILAGLALMISTPAWADGPPALQSANNLFVKVMIVLIVILALVIGMLAKILLGAATDLPGDSNQDRPIHPAPVAAIAGIAVTINLIFPSFAQAQSGPGDPIAGTGPTISSMLNGVSDTAFYMMAGIIFLELLVLVTLLYNVNLLVSARKKSRVASQEPAQAADLMSWRRYGLYCLILFAGVFLWHYYADPVAPLKSDENHVVLKRAEIQQAGDKKSEAGPIDANSVKLLTGVSDLAAGKKIFETTCFACHGMSGQGIVGPNLTDEFWLHGGSFEDVFKTINDGWPDNGMKSWKEDYSSSQIAQVASYVKSLGGTHPANPKLPQGALYK